jgi:hypothetical protein
VVEGFFLCCDPDFPLPFMELAKKEESIWSWFREKEISPRDARTLL